MKILSAIDSFKGSATSEELNQAAISLLDDHFETDTVAIADGGEGTLDAIYSVLDGEYHQITVHGALGQNVETDMLITETQHGRTAIIESAKIIGIDSIEVNEVNAEQASSYGLGEAILQAIDLKAETIMVTLGGTVTSDGGLGMLRALEMGSEFSHNPLLLEYRPDFMKINSNLRQIKIIGLADVTNTYSGSKGFAHIFGPQKGLNKEQIDRIDTKAKQFELYVSKVVSINLSILPGSGAAGGLGGALMTLGFEVQPGFKTISEMIRLEERISQADVIITGEGRVDSQTGGGKVPYSIAKLAEKHNKDVIVLCGSRTTDIGELDQLCAGVFCIHLGPLSLEEAMNRDCTLQAMSIASYNALKLYNRD